LAWHQHLAARLARPGTLEERDVSFDVGREKLLRIELLGIDVNGQHAVGPAAALLRCAGARQRAAEQLHHEGEPGTLVLAKGADRAFTLLVVPGSIWLERAIEQRGIAAYRAVRCNERIRWQCLASLARHQDLAFGDEGCREIEDERLLARSRHADGVGGRRHSPVDTTERCDEEAAGGIDEMNRNKPGLGSHFCPFAHAPHMTRVAHRNDREAHGAAFGDANLDRLGCGGLTQSVLRINDSQDWRLAYDLDLLIPNE